MNINPDFSGKMKDEVELLTKAKNTAFWASMIGIKYRNKFTRYREKYYSLLSAKNSPHHKIKLQLIDKLFTLEGGANSTQPTPINRAKVVFTDFISQLINLEYAPLTENKRFCIITGIDISDQKKGSRFLRENTLKNIIDHRPDLYRELAKKYLTDKAKKLAPDRQVYLICKNIRDSDSNPRNNRARFERRNYPKHQLQFKF